MAAGDYLTKKQVSALLRSADRAGEGPIPVDHCRKLGRRVVICHDRKGFYLSTSPRQRKHRTER